MQTNKLDDDDDDCSCKAKKAVYECRQCSKFSVVLSWLFKTF